MNQVFPSKISWWLFAPVLSSLGFFLLLSFVQQRWGASVVVLAVGAFLGYLLANTRYTLTPQELLITSGPIHKRVPITSITSVKPTRNPISSPALSLNRLEIRYGKYDSVLISPANPKGFLTTLHQLNPALRHD
ncbi:PH domain-containing protein [Hymenobacter taeanensis]|uniref:PH domain-containing protein n=1 Tax=Hymenobacter taeanensis TaxID=2735321 RepID=A0A6M6BMI3_9BACT|nr:MULTISPECIES: PH domain-containing protein [Hymenobacter]QJX49038.1 PH domain-containing protein [Hymenobacter taeanensis]UOQ81444.1 PH domain-containing protein [Hymenobacter sp. 5414T-23]